MINTDMRLYSYSTIGEIDAYGQPTISEPVGKIKMTINISNQSQENNILYSSANYIGLTQAEVNDTYIIYYGDKKLKVLYVNPKGRYKQVWLSDLMG